MTPELFCQDTETDQGGYFQDSHEDVRKPDKHITVNIIIIIKAWDTKWKHKDINITGSNKMHTYSM